MVAQFCDNVMPVVLGFSKVDVMVSQVANCQLTFDKSDYRRVHRDCGLHQ